MCCEGLSPDRVEPQKPIHVKLISKPGSILHLLTSLSLSFPTCRVGLLIVNNLTG